MICTRHGSAGEFVNGACPECRHPILLHPSTANRGVDHCVVCEMQSLMAEMREALK